MTINTTWLASSPEEKCSPGEGQCIMSDNADEKIGNGWSFMAMHF
jgi:hypothetical protein